MKPLSLELSVWGSFKDKFDFFDSLGVFRLPAPPPVRFQGVEFAPCVKCLFSFRGCRDASPLPLMSAFYGFSPFLSVSHNEEREASSAAGWSVPSVPPAGFALCVCLA